MRNKTSADPFGPDLTKPEQKIYCLHCNGEFTMAQMVYEQRLRSRQSKWYCPDPKCSGAGFGFDLWDEPWWRQDCRPS
jgi:hypothetical protein